MKLRPLVETDAEALIEANRSNRDYHAPWVQPPLDRAAFDNWFAGVVAGRTISLIGQMPDGGIIGIFNFSEIVLANFRSCYLGYYGMTAYAGRGLMSICLRAGLIHMREAVGLRRVEANIQPDNRRSIALVHRLGFRREGFSPAYLFIDGAWRDHERWAILLDEVSSHV
ncbi:MAG: GNAT family N-acetyltransferase [Acidiphilium sp.]|nr:GNAT family N-acetyltransferase [Acidiphilium sp.]MDD4935383.1 GNAT family N-acetyltransferase [Acidiphilium sp.]